MRSHWSIWQNRVGIACVVGIALSFSPSAFAAKNGDDNGHGGGGGGGKCKQSVTDRGTTDSGVIPGVFENSINHDDSRNSDLKLITAVSDRVGPTSVYDYITRDAPNNPAPFGAGIITNSSATPNGLLVLNNGRGIGFSNVTAFHKDGTVAWNVSPYTGPADDGVTPGSDVVPQKASVDEDGNIFVWDKNGIFKIDQDDGHVIWFADARTIGAGFPALAASFTPKGQAGAPNGLVGGVTIDGYHFWVDRATGETVASHAPVAFATRPCPPILPATFELNGGEYRTQNPLIWCVAIGASAPAEGPGLPSANTSAVIPVIPGGSRTQPLYIFTYAGTADQPNTDRLMAFTFTTNAQGNVNGVQQVWEYRAGSAGGAGASPAVTADMKTVFFATPGLLNIVDVETGQQQATGPAVNAIASPAVSADDNLISCSVPSISSIRPDGTLNWENPLEIGPDILPNKVPIPFLFFGRPQSACSSIVALSPTQATIQVLGGYAWYLGVFIGRALGGIGNLIPHILTDVVIDQQTGAIVPPFDVKYKGSGEVFFGPTPHGTYEGLRFDTVNILYWYLIQGNLFGTPSLIPPNYAAGPPPCGGVISEPVSWREQTQVQLTSALMYVDEALAGAQPPKGKLCPDLDEGAARAGYAASILDSFVLKPGETAVDRGQITAAELATVEANIGPAAAKLSSARALLVSNQPKAPKNKDRSDAIALIQQAKTQVEAAIAALP